jgi:hypothetical protein
MQPIHLALSISRYFYMHNPVIELQGFCKRTGKLLQSKSIHLLQRKLLTADSMAASVVVLSA